MEINQRTIKALEWTSILEALAKQASSEIGKERCLNTPIYNDINTIKLEQTFTTQARFMLDQAIYPPLAGIMNINAALEIAKSGQCLNNLELIDVAKTIAASRRLKSFFARYQEEVPLLFEISLDLFEHKELEENILNIFDNAGNMLDTASQELRRLRVSLKDQTINLKNKLNSIVQSSKYSKYLQEPVYTIRDDRYVLPVKVEFKSNVPGIVHDSSSSGATLFIEPNEIISLNNQLREIELKIEYEIKRILAELTAQIREHAQDMTYMIDKLADIDFIFAKAKYSIVLKATEPTINTEKYIILKNIKHPILLTTIENVIPNDFELGKDWNTLIITGSNTGGKTVILKTVGLCTLMTKAGLHVPANEANIYPFKHIFADIGDEQSVIQNLSTFSGHMTNIINIINNSDDDSLILLDELGAGTDPSEGSALAQSILESFSKKGIRTVITTHYGELKALAYTQTGFYNASVEFNIDNLSPTYKLLMGLPGKSNAITIALNLGLKEQIAKNAQNIYINQKDQTGEILEDLQNTQQELSRNAQQVEQTKDELEKLEEEYNQKLEKINSEKKRTISLYKKKFETELTNARQEIKQILEEIRRTKSEKIARRSSNRINQIEGLLRETRQSEEEQFETKYPPINWAEISLNDIVIVKDLEQEAVLVSLPDKNKNVQIQLGQIKTTVKASKLALFTGTKPQEKTKHRTDYKGFEFSRTNISNTLDLRGKRVEDGLDELEYYLDKANLANLTPVYIIHGHGTGALRSAIREYLRTSPYVNTFRPGENTEGGDGVSVIDLK